MGASGPFNRNSLTIDQIDGHLSDISGFPYEETEEANLTVYKVKEDSCDQIADWLACIKETDLRQMTGVNGSASTALTLAETHLQESCVRVPVQDYQDYEEHGIDLATNGFRLVLAKEAYDHEWGRGEGEVILAMDDQFRKPILQQVERIANMGDAQAQEIAGKANYRDAILAGSKALRNQCLEKAAYHYSALAKNPQSDKSTVSLAKHMLKDIDERKEMPVSARFNPAPQILA